MTAGEKTKISGRRIISLSLAEDMDKRVRSEARKQKISVSAYIRQCISVYQRFDTPVRKSFER